MITSPIRDSFQMARHVDQEVRNSEEGHLVLKNPDGFKVDSMWYCLWKKSGEKTSWGW